MAKVQAYILNGGRDQILSASAGFGRYVPYSFSVGDTAAFVPTSNETQARGNIVYTGDSNLMQSRLLEDGEVRYSFIIPEGAGPFNVGNVVMYTMGGSGVPTPFMMVVLPYPIPKKVSAYDTGTVGLGVPGNRLLVNITLKQEIVDPNNPDISITIHIISPEYANLSFLDTDSNVPAPELNPWSQFILHETDLTKTPAFVSKDSQDQYWIMPFFKQLHSPNYDVLGGGVVGDKHIEADFPTMWGHRFITPDSQYRGVIGGASFKNAGATPQSVGGAPFIKPV